MVVPFGGMFFSANRVENGLNVNYHTIVDCPHTAKISPCYSTSMNALRLHRIFKYKSSPKCLATAARIIQTKVKRQSVLLKKYKVAGYECDIKSVRNMRQLLLEEARAAKYFWSKYRSNLSKELRFYRRPKSVDPINRLLDIGYHHLAGKVRKILIAHAIPTQVGLLHSANSTDAGPLVYDLMEMFRADIVDSELIRFVHLKKKPIVVDQKLIAAFLFRVNARLQKLFYIKEFRQCHTYLYYIELQILRFIKGVNHNEIFNPLHLPTRNESRCNTKKVTKDLQEIPDLS